MSLIDHVRAEQARDPLRFVPDVPAEPYRPGRIIREVAAKYGRTVDELTGPLRWRSIAWARQEAMFRLRNETTLSYPDIGRRLNRDHTTILHGVRAHAKRMAEGRADE